VKEYQDRIRELETRCYMVEKKLMLADNMGKKVEKWVEEVGK